jgi:hypothetical protein
MRINIVVFIMKTDAIYLAKVVIKSSAVSMIT